MPTPEARRERRVARRLRWGLPIVLAVCFAALALLWAGHIASNQEQSKEQQVEACERGNVLRRHIALIEGIISAELPDDLDVIEEHPCNTLK